MSYKRHINVTIDADIVAQAKQKHNNLSAVIEKLLADSLNMELPKPKPKQSDKDRALEILKAARPASYVNAVGLICDEMDIPEMRAKSWIKTHRNMGNIIVDCGSIM